ncbi:trigger factor [Maribellus comscasis]|uniref:Trigger factor n=1 Tax=Maribellus comscasis TaxID=2681766 RepID=A0A6I6JPA9_9BACT|nr:trigger factor [Maribellus comscasis]QGY44806.1 trigger factor [Maribellus comscasis]
MNITRENIDDVNAVLKVGIEKADYEKAVNDTLKDYRQKASVPGFRPGKVPAGLIKKRFGTAVLVEEVNKVLSQSLSKYLVEEKLNILGEPLPNEEQQKSINWDTDEDFEFVFDIALAPEVKVTLDKRSKYDYYKIAVSEEMIDQQVDMVASQLGQNVPVEEVKDNSSVRGDFVQLDENGEPVEDGIQPTGVLLGVDMIKDEEIKNAFVGRKKDDTLVFDPVKAFDNRHEVGHMLNIKHEEADELNSEFKFTITEILQFEKAEINEELFKKVYGEETEINTVEDFRNKIKEEIAANLVYSSDQKFTVDTRDTLLEKIKVELPETFLKRWLIAANKDNKDVTEEQIENEFEYFIKDLQWQLIKDSIIKENELKVTPEETQDFAKQMARAQYSQYGIHDVPAEQLESFAKMIMEKPEESERIYKKLYEDKVIEVVKEKVNIQEKEISQEEFNEMMK